MALLGGPQNSVNSNRSFDEKLPIFSSSTYLTTQVIAKSLSGQGTFLSELSTRLPSTEIWNRIQVEERAKGLLSLLCDALEVDCVDPGDFVASSVENDRSADNRIPQADDPDRMLQILKLVSSGNESISDVAIAAGADKRHAGYYLSALSIIGLLESDEGNWSLTEEGIEVVAAESPRDALRNVMVETPLMLAWSEFSTTAQKDSFLAKHDISGTTINRRRQTLDSWYSWCYPELG
jgi:predicted transcriptional regulator